MNETSNKLNDTGTTKVNNSRIDIIIASLEDLTSRVYRDTDELNHRMDKLLGRREEEPCSDDQSIREPQGFIEKIELMLSVLDEALRSQRMASIRIDDIL